MRLRSSCGIELYDDDNDDDLMQAGVECLVSFKNYTVYV